MHRFDATESLDTGNGIGTSPSLLDFAARLDQTLHKSNVLMISISLFNHGMVPLLKVQYCAERRKRCIHLFQYNPEGGLTIKAVSLKYQGKSFLCAADVHWIAVFQSTNTTFKSYFP